jgi:dolichol-phosphate mannosyltransferase
MEDRPDLIVVMPVFNEAASIETVVREWTAELALSGAKFELLVINDGSTDQTARILSEIQESSGQNLRIINRPNQGHGQSCIEGYRTAIQRQIPDILQIDSDGQSSPDHFGAIWAMRENFDVVYGNRKRSDGLRRVIASWILKLALRLLAKVNCVDANVPYRLMNTKSCESAIQRIPKQIFLANVALAVLLRKQPGLRHGELPIGFPPRIGGEPSVPFKKFLSKAIELFVQLKREGIC